MATVSIVPRCHIVALSVGAQCCASLSYCQTLRRGSKAHRGKPLIFLPKGENTIVASKKRKEGERGVDKGDFEKKIPKIGIQ